MLPLFLATRDLGYERLNRYAFFIAENAKVFPLDFYRKYFMDWRILIFNGVVGVDNRINARDTSRGIEIPSALTLLDVLSCIKPSLHS